MKKYLWAAILIIAAIGAYIYTSPKSIIREYEGVVCGYENQSTNERVKVSLHGELYPKVFSDNYFIGRIEIDGQKINVASPIPGNFKVSMQGIKDKINRHYIFLASSGGEDGYTRTYGTFNVTRDFSCLIGSTDQIREKYKSNNVIIVCPAVNNEEAKKILSDTKKWNY